MGFRKEVMKLGLIVLAAFLTACTNDNEAVKALSDNGFSNITITDRGGVFAGWAGCDSKDGNWYHADATNPAGRPVHMLVCCGSAMSFKGCTVRSK